jgi:hypothetical protein
MSFNDDEVPAPARPTGFTGLPARQVQLIKYHSRSAPLAPNDQEVLLELRGIASAAAREPLDLVAVIDTSGSMGDGGKLDKAKNALCFVIRKLTDRDRLCVVQFYHEASRLCPLRRATEAAQAELEALVRGFVAGGGTNIQKGLEIGLGVVNGRRVIAGRAASVMLMSDGEENNGDARSVAPGDVPVHTFGFGSGHDARLLGAVADKSLGGVFNYVADSDSPTNLTETFSQVLGGLLTIIAQDLELIVTPLPGEATIRKPVDAGSFPAIPATDGSSSVTVRFGTLYSAEERKVIVELALSDRTASRPYRANVVQVQYQFTFQGQRVMSDPDRITIRRGRGTAAGDPAADAPAQVRTEVARRRHVDSIKAAMEKAEGDRLEDARDILAEALRALERIVDPMVDMLRRELQRLLELFRTKDTYREQGRPYAISSLASHGRQRFTARGDAEEVRLFATRRMDIYLEQAKRPDEKPPSADEDVREEPEPERAVPQDCERWTVMSVALRLLATVLSLLAFSIMARARTSGWDGDRYGRYEPYRLVTTCTRSFFLCSFFFWDHLFVWTKKTTLFLNIKDKPAYVVCTHRVDIYIKNYKSS